MLVANGISLIEVDYSLFALGRNQRLVQNPLADTEILKRRLCDAIRSQSPAMP